jgi:hypothetical protein
VVPDYSIAVGSDSLALGGPVVPDYSIPANTGSLPMGGATVPDYSVPDTLGAFALGTPTVPDYSIAGNSTGSTMALGGPVVEEQPAGVSGSFAVYAPFDPTAAFAVPDFGSFNVHTGSDDGTNPAVTPAATTGANGGVTTLEDVVASGDLQNALAGAGLADDVAALGGVGALTSLLGGT